MKRLGIGLLAIMILSLLGTCTMNYFGKAPLRQSQPDFSALRQELPTLDFSREVKRTPAIQAYCDYYQICFSEAEHRLGTFQSGKYELAAQIFTPSHVRGTVILLHGYIDHTGTQRHLIRNCLEQNLRVATYDLPGHGLSSGRRMAIDDFSDYAEGFHIFLERIQTFLPGPYYFIGHSTGCAIAYEYLAQYSLHDFERIIFLAPLVRHVHWHISKIPYFFGKLFAVETVPRRYSEISSDPAFLDFLRRDPLQTDDVPYTWISALYHWNQRIQELPVLPVDLHILQGTRDTVVDQEYNIPFLERKVENVQVVRIEGAAHQLANESPALREKVFQTINTFLKEKEI